MAINYAILTGAEMVETIAGVPQIRDRTLAVINPVTGLLGSARPSLTFFSMYVSGIVGGGGGNGPLSFSLYVPQPLDVSDASLLAMAKWMPVLSIHPLDDAATDPEAMPLFTNDGEFPSPTTRLLPLIFTLQGTSSASEFVISVNFKHSIF